MKTITKKDRKIDVNYDLLIEYLEECIDRDYSNMKDKPAKKDFQKWLHMHLKVSNANLFILRQTEPYYEKLRKQLKKQEKGV